MEQLSKKSTVWGPAERGIVQAIVVSLIVAVVPTALGVWNILQSPWSSFVISEANKWHILTMKAFCYTTLGACTKGYVVVTVIWILGTLGSYFAAKRRYESFGERKQMWIAFLITFPFANYGIGYAALIGIFILEALKFGL